MLSNQLLIAMPSVHETVFEKTVIYICEHNIDGAVGLIVNQPTDVSLRFVFEQLAIDISKKAICEQPVLFGGPVQQERGFVLHRNSDNIASSIAVSGDIALSTSQEILRMLAVGRGPKKSLVTLGYAGWEANQLDEEIKQNQWLSCPASQALLFDLPFNERWLKAGLSLGVDMSLMGGAAGHA